MHKIVTISHPTPYHLLSVTLISFSAAAAGWDQIIYSYRNSTLITGSDQWRIGMRIDKKNTSTAGVPRFTTVFIEHMCTIGNHKQV